MIMGEIKMTGNIGNFYQNNHQWGNYGHHSMKGMQKHGGIHHLHNGHKAHGHHGGFPGMNRGHIPFFKDMTNGALWPDKGFNPPNFEPYRGLMPPGNGTAGQSTIPGKLSNINIPFDIGKNTSGSTRLGGIAPPVISDAGRETQPRLGGIAPPINIGTGNSGTRLGGIAPPMNLG